MGLKKILNRGKYIHEDSNIEGKIIC